MATASTRNPRRWAREGASASASAPRRRLAPRRAAARCGAGAAVEAGETVVVLGATGGVGQLTVAKLAERGFKVRAVSRNAARCAQIFAGAGGASDAIECVAADGRDEASLAGLFEGAAAVIACTGTTAFPSARWKADENGSNNPRQTDIVGATNCMKAAAEQRGAELKRYALLTSVGTERYDQFPYKVLNAFGVLECKAEAERYLREQSGLAYTIVRPCRLTDGPYTSYGTPLSHPTSPHPPPIRPRFAHALVAALLATCSAHAPVLTCARPHGTRVPVRSRGCRPEHAAEGRRRRAPGRGPRAG